MVILLCAAEVISDAVAELLLVVHLLIVALLFILCIVGIGNREPIMYLFLTNVKIIFL